MKSFNPQAVSLNQTIENCSHPVAEMLSEKGRAIFFPSSGILAQSAAARNTQINATIGMAKEDDGSPMCLSAIDNLVQMEAEKVFPYAPSYGLPQLRQEWQKHMKRKNPSLADKTVSLPLVTQALTHALSLLGYLFVNPDDEIIHADLFWGNYKLVFAHGFNARLKPYRFFSNGGFNLDSFREAVSAGKNRKKVVILNFPNNPAGYTPTLDEAGQISEILLKAAESGHRLLVIMDDAYFGLVYEKGIFRESMFACLSDLHENILAVKVDGATKEDFAWGLRVGFITYGIKNGSEELYTALEHKTAGALRGNISSVSRLSQSLVLKALVSGDYLENKKDKFTILAERYARVKEILQQHPEYSDCFFPLPFNSGYFMCLELKNGPAEPVRQILLEQYSTGVIAINNLIRIAFSSTPCAQLEQLFQNIYAACMQQDN